MGLATRKALSVKQDVCFFSQPWRLSVLSRLPEAYITGVEGEVQGAQSHPQKFLFCKMP